ncbi:MAG: squalene--hopene cyclase [Chromatiales bacterium]|nr:squalene--hopene cyclase [Chromatiales bacterium]
METVPLIRENPETLDTQPATAISAALGWLRTAQDPAGYWVGMLESNCCMEAEWLLAFHVLGYRHPEQPAIMQGLLDRQRADGSWETYHGAPAGDINATVECYAALRCVGLAADHPALSRARAWIFRHGGLRGVRVFTRYWLALIGEWPWARTPNLPPEIIRFPLWFPFSIYNFASWARATMVPLCILSARRHVRPLPPERRLDELFPEGREAFDYRLPRRGGLFSWDTFFRLADSALHRLQSLGLTPGRRAAEARCLEWVIRHQDADGAWGGIQPPWIYGLMALHAAGYPLSHPVLAAGLSALDQHWSYWRDGSLRIQASESPVWDTALTLLAMLDCGCTPESHPEMGRALDWLLDREVRHPGDWSVRQPGVEPGGWAFERANLHYPDVDDTAVVLIILARLRRLGVPAERLEGPIRRARDWLLAMECSGGGWAAFDRDNNREILTRIPFCDFGEALDPPSADVTAHVLEAFGELGMDAHHPAIVRGLDFLRREQESWGSWFGRWGVNHIYGTAAVLPALRHVGEDMDSGYVRRAADWLASVQNPDGGWGESCASYMDADLIGRGPSTASQTAWALFGLLAVDREAYASSIERGVRYLVATQREGTWEEPWFTGTGFPGYGVGARTRLGEPGLSARLAQGKELQRGFMINYNLYRHYFPLAALGRAARG